MMKMTMRLDKSQIPDTVKITATSKINLAPYAMAGYVHADVMLVGALGGRAGYSQKSGAGTVYGAGGGGGGAVRRKLRIGEVVARAFSGGPAQCIIGTAGTKGADRVGTGDDGTNGGNTQFDTLVAYGGEGASAGGWSLSHPIPSNGGDGGSNKWTNPDNPSEIVVLGEPGIGGLPSTTGMWEDRFYEGGEGDGGGGGGGGGGTGGILQSGDLTGDPDPGKPGNSLTSGGSGATYGPGGAVSGRFGGFGGGANIKPIIGTDEYYGGISISADNKFSQGVIAIKFL